MFCVNCQKDVDPEIITGADIYGPKFRFASAPYARCPVCGNYGECAVKEAPFLVIPDFRLRKAYNFIDSILNLIWMQQKMSKAEMLFRMADLLYNNKKPYRTRDIESYDEACRAYRLAKKLKKECFSNVEISA